jgi:hypothetical protein
MSGEQALEVRRDGRIYRAGGMEMLLQWAREHRISLEDHYRVAGTEPWLPVNGEQALSSLLDPENWWTLKMGGRTFIAPDWDTVVLWTREGRLTEDVQITGPKTPPGGILGKASPELAPYLREPVPEEPEVSPPRLRFDGRSFLPGDLDTVRKWIGESRVPLEAEISIDGGDWTRLRDTGLFPDDLWPSEATEEEPHLRLQQPVQEPFAEPRTVVVGQDAASTGIPSGDRAPDLVEEEPYRVTTTFGEDFIFHQPVEILKLVSRKKVHGFNEIRHSDLPGGSMFVGEFIETMNLKKPSSALFWTLMILFAAAAVAGIVLSRGTGWMLYAGIGAAAVSVAFLAGALWKGR